MAPPTHQGPPNQGLGAVANRLGPYEQWMFDIGKVFDLPDLMLQDAAHLSAVAEFSHPVAVSDLAGLSSTVQPGGSQHWIRLPALYRHAGFRPRFLPFLISPVHASAPGARLDRPRRRRRAGLCREFRPRRHPAPRHHHASFA